MATALMLLTGAFWVTGLAVPAAAQASTTAVNQCNGHGPAAQGATTAMRCTGSVVNTISATTTYSTTTVTRLCTLGPCSAGNGTFTTGSIALVTTISACNSSDNDAAHAISCTVKVTNNIGVNTSGAQQVSPASVHQCVGSAAGGVPDCQPASATGTTLTRCNGSGNGGGAVVHCQVDPQSAVSAAVPITVNQCNGTAERGRIVAELRGQHHHQHQGLHRSADPDAHADRYHYRASDHAGSRRPGLERDRAERWLGSHGDAEPGCCPGAGLLGQRTGLPQVCPGRPARPLCPPGPSRAARPKALILRRFPARTGAERGWLVV
jgi:hypothetical protein